MPVEVGWRVELTLAVDRVLSLAFLASGFLAGGCPKTRSLDLAEQPGSPESARMIRPQNLFLDFVSRLGVGIGQCCSTERQFVSRDVVQAVGRIGMPFAEQLALDDEGLLDQFQGALRVAQGIEG